MENKYDTFLIKTLRKGKFLVSSELCKELISKFGITESNARKIIERSAAKEIIISSKPLSFSKGQFVYFLPGQVLSKDRIKEISKKYRPSLYRLLEALDRNEGILSYYEALKISSSPLEKSSSKVDYLDDLLIILKERQIVYEYKDRNGINYIVLKSKERDCEHLVSIHYSKMLIDTMLVNDIVQWFKKSNIIDNNSAIFRNKKTPWSGAKHNNLVWDAIGYTKTTGINPGSAKNSKTFDKQTLVVLDIVINREYESFDLDGFYNRIQINLNSVKNGQRKVLPIIVYKECSRFVLNKTKSLGFLCYDIGSIYGSKIFEIIDNLNSLQSSQSIEKRDFQQKVDEILNSIELSGQEEQLKAIKGILFEVMIYQLLKNCYPNAAITPNYRYYRIINKDDVETKVVYEYDYVIRSNNPKEIIIIELKGNHANHEIPLGNSETKNTISWFFNRTLPFIKEKFSSDIADEYSFKASYITSGKYEKDALERLIKYNKGDFKSKQLDVFYDRQKLLQLMDENDFKSLKAVIDKFYK
ncbi:MAG: hypothetical protein K0R65_2793 [Crocinitomicaceae bacterium]|jgi:hypothetical protein|nr:hypothetical protein [Crocinitomicaceae bacterium]